MDGIAEQTENAQFKQMLVQMRKDVEEGKPFSSALARYPKSFSPLYINMVRASELSGGFPDMLDRIAGYLSQQIETRAMIVGAMIYPAIIALMAVVTTIFLLTFVLPRFMVLFAGKEAVLPAATRLLMAVSGFLMQLLVCAGAGPDRDRVGLRPGSANRPRPAGVRPDEARHSAASQDVPRACTSAADCTPWANSSTPAFRSWRRSASPPR